eukprot:symbB.v1.2.017602.t1/scaffold1376.1/size122662/2
MSPVIWRRSLHRHFAALTIDDVPLLISPSTLEEGEYLWFPQTGECVTDNTTVDKWFALEEPWDHVVGSMVREEDGLDVELFLFMAEAESQPVLRFAAHPSSVIRFPEDPGHFVRKMIGSAEMSPAPRLGCPADVPWRKELEALSKAQYDQQNWTRLVMSKY